MLFRFFLCVFFQFFSSLVLVFSFPVWTSSLVSFYILNTRFVLYFFFFTCTASVHFSKNFSRIRSVEGEKNKQHILCFFFLCVCMCTTLPNHKNVHSFFVNCIYIIGFMHFTWVFIFFRKKKREKTTINMFCSSLIHIKVNVGISFFSLAYFWCVKYLNFVWLN